jgi:hypothetical protein
MALQNSGTIGIGNLRSEFAAISPAPLSQFYRNGPHVPGSVPGNTTPGSPACSDCSPTSTYFQAVDVNPRPSPFNSPCPYWDQKLFQCYTPVGTWSWWTYGNPCNPTNGIGISCASEPTGLYGSMSCEPSLSPPATYYTCSLGACNKTAGPGGSNPPSPINTGVPTGGRISLSNFYGATK